MTYDPDALRQMHIEQELRISELSNALQIVTDQRNNLEDSLQAAMQELQSRDTHISNLGAIIDRLRTHIAQGLEL